MKRLLLGVLVATMAFAAFAVPAANASVRCSGGQGYTTKSGSFVRTSDFRALQQADLGYDKRVPTMQCSSVRYVMNFIKRKVASRGGYPRLPGPFYDGYVTWYCNTDRSGRKVWCSEYDSGTGFSFRAAIY